MLCRVNFCENMRCFRTNDHFISLHTLSLTGLSLKEVFINVRFYPIFGVFLIVVCRDAGVAKRGRLKICWLSAFAGSNPAPCICIFGSGFEF